MTNDTAPRTHDTKHPLTCCERCHKAELAGRSRKRPTLRFGRTEVGEGPFSYQVFHGDDLVATVSREAKTGGLSYEVIVEWDADDQQLRAGSLRDARALAEEAYTAVWREGIPALRGPASDI